MAENVEVVLYHGAGDYTISDAANQRFVDWESQWNENYPRQVKIMLLNREGGTSNLLDSTCNLWSSGTGALALGDKVRFYIRLTSSGVKTEVMYGKVIDLEQGSDGILIITAKCYLVNLESRKADKIVFKNYKDRAIKDTDVVAGANVITDITDSDILAPFVAVEYATNDAQLDIGDSSAKEAENIKDGYDVAQAFIAPGDGILGVWVAYNNDQTGNLKISLQGTNADDEPDGVDIASNEFAMENPSDASYDGYSLLVSSGPAPVVKGKKYWIVFHTAANDGTLTTIRTRGTSNYWITSHLWKSDGTNWAEQANEALDLLIDYVEYDSVPASDYAWDDANDRIVVVGNLAITAALQSYADPHRGRVSYYYGTKPLNEIAGELLGLDSEITSAIPADWERTFKIYQMRGRFLIECMRELAAIFETSGTYSGRQHTFAHYESGGTNYVKGAFAYNLSDSSVRTFSDSSATDDELRIIDVKLKKTIKLRPASVIIVGTAPSGAPIVAARDDRGLSTSLRTKTGIPLTETISDENIHTLEEADKAAWAYLDSVARDVWEGSIVVSGWYPDLMELSALTAYIGSGKIITLNWAPMGISATKLKVTGVICRADHTTEILVNNKDLLIENQFRIAARKADYLESVQGPTEPSKTLFFHCFKDAAVTTATLYMQLSKSNGTAIDGLTRAKCTKLSNSRYNMNTYHAEFEAGNGYTIDGTSLVTRIELYDAASGGSEVSEYVLLTYEQFPKWKTTRVIVDFNAKIS